MSNERPTTLRIGGSAASNYICASSAEPLNLELATLRFRLLLAADNRAARRAETIDCSFDDAKELI